MEHQTFQQNSNQTHKTIFKYGQKVYSLFSLHSGSITSIDYETNSLVINRGDELGLETISMSNVTTDVEEILALLRAQVEEYKESFFRVKDTLQKVEGRLR